MKPLLLLFILPASLFASWRYEEGGTRVEIDTTRTGQLIHWVDDGKTWVDNRAQAAPPLQSGKKSFRAESATQEKDGVVIQGKLGGETPATLAYRIEEGGRRLRVTLTTGGKHDELSWSLPLALQPRKRIWYRGDRGLEWDTRHFYQFTASTFTALLPRPDRNEWRYFALDQRRPDGFRLWRCESAKTSPLLMQEGETAEPRVQIYDERGGVSVEIADTASPYSLRVDAAGGAVAQVVFPGREPTHEIVLSVHPSEAAVLKARGKPTRIDRPAPETALQEPAWLRETPDATGTQYVTGGYPFAAGTLTSMENVRVQVAGNPVAVQAKPLAFWPDGSIKWGLLTFPIDPAKAVKSAEPPRISFRTGRFLPVTVSTKKEKTAAPEAALTLHVAQPADGKATITNGKLEATLSTGNRWLESLRWEGVEQLSGDPAARLAYADYRLDPKAVDPFEGTLSGGADDRGTLKVDSLTVEESGPLRAIIRLEGLTDNREPTRIILRLEFLAGRPEIRITHTAVLRFLDPRKIFLTGLGLELPLTREGTLRFGGFSDKAGGGAASLVQQTPLQSERRSDGDAPLPGGRAPGWGTTGTHFAMIRNFWQQAPHALTFDANRLQLELWPSDGPPMDMRRYSNEPHRAQGESAAPDASWVKETYYANGPVYGLSRTHELLLSFAPQEAEALAADFQSPPLLYAGWEPYRAATLAAAEEKDAPRAWENWTRLAQFWLHHRALYEWYGFWHFGDVRHRFRDGYGRIATPERLLADRPWEQTKWNKAVDQASGIGRGDLTQDYQTQNDWAYDNGRWGWSNTEGLPGLFFQNEYLRHGNRSVYFAAEAAGRHARDVVTRQEGSYFGLGTRHGVQHWSDGNHEERQTTITEYRLHYFLSGEPRSREVLENLYQGVYSRKNVSSAAAHSGRLGGLLFHWEVTGSPEEAEALHRYTRFFLSPKGLYVHPAVHFPDLKVGAREGLNDGTMFFQTFGGMHALLEYQQLTKDPEIAASVIAMADSVLNDPEMNAKYRQGKASTGNIFWPAIAFAALHAPKPEPYRELLDALVRNGYWKATYQSVTRNPAHWSGPTAFLDRNVSGGMFWNNWAPYMVQAIDETKLWDEAIAAAFRQYEAEGRPETPWRTSWQSQYDNHPELRVYLQQPWLEPSPAAHQESPPLTAPPAGGPKAADRSH
ncbi:MAG TPA: hypothetical protein VNQ90_20735 [Chthoniobacteraceae bacterium]|nr:hypothetical protein [Chthoniobacteraceae bacterium]